MAIAACVISGLIAGVCSWVGETSQHSGVRFTTLLGAGFNIVPPAVLLLGVGLLTLGIWPRAVSITVYGVLAWSFLVDLIGGIIGLNHWVLDSSVFHQIAVAPAVAPNWTTNGILVAVGLAMATIGGIAFMHRDLQGA